MAMNKKYIKWFIVIAVIVIAAILIYVFRCKLFPSLFSCVDDPNKNNTPVPQGSPTTTWVKESFPLNVGMFGPKIKALQKALGFQDTNKNAPNFQDGYFGSAETKPAVIAKGKSVPLTQTAYDDILNPPTVCLTRPKLSSDQWITGRPVYALFSRAVKTSPDNSSDTIRILKTCETASYKGPASIPGWSKVGTNKDGQGVDGYIATAAVTQFSDGL